MSGNELEWVHERQARWDEDKARVIGDAEDGMFEAFYGELVPGDAAPGEWWRVESSGETVGFGWLDVTWGDAEILLAVDPEHRGEGVGSFILKKLDEEARQRGLNYLYNVVPDSHPQQAEVTEWLHQRGFQLSQDDNLLKRPVRR